MKRNNAIKIIIALFFILFVVDIVLTLQLGHLVQYLEANPIYPYVGIPGIILANLLVMFLMYWHYSHTNNNFYRYSWLMILLTICVVRVFVIYNNYQVFLDPPTIEMAKQVTVEMKQQAMVRVVAPTVVPFFIGMFTFLLFKMDHEVKIKE